MHPTLPPAPRHAIHGSSMKSRRVGSVGGTMGVFFLDLLLGSVLVRGAASDVWYHHIHPVVIVKIEKTSRLFFFLTSHEHKGARKTWKKICCGIFEWSKKSLWDNYFSQEKNSHNIFFPQETKVPQYNFLFFFQALKGFVRPWEIFVEKKNVFGLVFVVRW